MATHSSVLAWRILGTGEPGGLPSMGSHRVGHNWHDLAARQLMATRSSILAWKIPCSEEPDRLQSIRSQRARHDWVTNRHKARNFFFFFVFICLFGWVLVVTQMLWSAWAQLPQGMWDLSSLSPTWDQMHVLCIGRQTPNHGTTREVSRYFRF